MGCCCPKSEPPPPAFDPVIGLSDKFKAGGVQVQGSAISGNGSVLGDSPVLQDKAYFEVTIVEPGSFAVGLATKETPLDGVLSQARQCELTLLLAAAHNLRSCGCCTGQGGDGMDGG